MGDTYKDSARNKNNKGSIRRKGWRYEEDQEMVSHEGTVFLYRKGSMDDIVTDEADDNEETRR